MHRWAGYFGGMKVKTSITLDGDVLDAIDEHLGKFKSRSEFIEAATKKTISDIRRQERDRRDIEIINKNAKRLNREAMDALKYQVPL